MESLEDTLTGYLPLLTRTLEERYGQMLDDWLSGGSLTRVSWQLSPTFQINEKSVKSFIKRVIIDAIKNEDFGLYLAGQGPFKAAQLGQLLDTIYAPCVAELQRGMKDSITKVIGFAPTEAAERELIEVVTGREPARSLKEREDSIGYLVDTNANPLPMGAKTLIDLRYQPKRGIGIYTGLSDGELHPVWREVEDVLPEEVRSLIAVDDGTWR